MIVSAEGKKSSAQAKKDGDWETLLAEVESLSSVDELNAYRQNLPDRLKFTPNGWIDPVYNACEHKEADLRLLEMDAVVGQIMRGER